MLRSAKPQPKTIINEQLYSFNQLPNDDVRCQVKNTVMPKVVNKQLRERVMIVKPLLTPSTRRRRFALSANSVIALFWFLTTPRNSVLLIAHYDPYRNYKDFISQSLHYIHLTYYPRDTSCSRMTANNDTNRKEQDETKPQTNVIYPIEDLYVDDPKKNTKAYQVNSEKITNKTDKISGKDLSFELAPKEKKKKSEGRWSHFKEIYAFSDRTDLKVGSSTCLVVCETVCARVF
ncbi:unnamed protein product [Strongylus vulgaris]|uniref:Uncharacterized protein n=1 Tax=Strongylus vulgaris TaxID=40348 RepID=A0A3P7J4G6_STRVU|nr:unnamed protein product [Strongylus vulgaris]